MASSKKEIAKSVKTLLVMLQSVRNQQVTITLRNDTIVKGTILSVDASMNIELENVSVDIDHFYLTNTPTTDEQLQAIAVDESVPQSEDIGEDSMMMDRDLDINQTTSDSEIKDYEKELELERSDRNTNDDCLTSVNNNSGNGNIKLYDYFIVKGTSIRHIDLPSDCDLLASAKCEIERIRNRRKQWTKRDIVHGHS